MARFDEADALLPPSSLTSRPYGTRSHKIAFLRSPITWIACFLTAAATVTTIYLQPQWLLSQLASTYPQVVWSTCLRQGISAIALTIDDAPFGGGNTTEKILDILASAGAKATFFIIVQQVKTERHRSLLRRMVNEGHELGNHMSTDSKSVLLSDAEYLRQLRDCDILLRQFQPRGVHWHRPGGGFLSQRTLALAASNGYTTVLGSVYPHDAQIASSTLTAWHLRVRARAGAILIIHDRFHTPEMLQMALPLLTRRFEVGTISQLKKLAVDC